MSPNKRRKVLCPWPYAIDLVARRYHLAPWAVKAAPMAEVLETLAIMGAESETLEALAGLKPDDVMYWGDDE